jgi:purine-binding chemotaxis protein CheW
MASTPHQDAPPGSGSSLQELLAFIDLETAPSLMLDRALLQERATRNIRVKNPYISFVLGGCEMALSIRSLQEIGYLPSITPLPNLPAWIKGIIQIRGEILSVVDFVALFGLVEERGHGQHNSYLLFKQQEFKFCLPVHRITGVVNFDEQRDHLETLAPGQAAILAGLAGFFKGVLTIDHRRVCILDSDTLGNSPLIKKWQ